MKNKIFGVLMGVGIACFFFGYSWESSIFTDVSIENQRRIKSIHDWPVVKGDYTPAYFLYGVGALSCLLGIFALALPGEVRSGAKLNSENPPTREQPSVSSAESFASAELASLRSRSGSNSQRVATDQHGQDDVSTQTREEREKREREVDEVIAKRMQDESVAKLVRIGHEREIERVTREAETELRKIQASERLALFNRVTIRSFLAVRSSLDESIGQVPAVLMLLAVGVVGLVFWLMIMREIPLAAIPIVFLGIVAVIAVWFPADKRLKSMLASADKSLMECEQSRVIYEKHLAGVAYKLMTGLKAGPAKRLQQSSEVLTQANFVTFVAVLLIIAALAFFWRGC